MRTFTLRILLIFFFGAQAKLYAGDPPYRPRIPRSPTCGRNYSIVDELFAGRQPERFADEAYRDLQNTDWNQPHHFWSRLFEKLPTRAWHSATPTPELTAKEIFRYQSSLLKTLGKWKVDQTEPEKIALLLRAVLSADIDRIKQLSAVAETAHERYERNQTAPNRAARLEEWNLALDNLQTATDDLLFKFFQLSRMDEEFIESLPKNERNEIAHLVNSILPTHFALTGTEYTEVRVRTVHSSLTSKPPQGYEAKLNPTGSDLEKFVASLGELRPGVPYRLVTVPSEAMGSLGVATIFLWA